MRLSRDVDEMFLGAGVLKWQSVSSGPVPLHGEILLAVSSEPSKGIHDLTSTVTGAVKITFLFLHRKERRRDLKVSAHELNESPTKNVPTPSCTK